VAKAAGLNCRATEDVLLFVAETPPRKQHGIMKKTDRVSIFLRKQTKLIGDKVTIGSRLRCFIS